MQLVFLIQIIYNKQDKVVAVVIVRSINRGWFILMFEKIWRKSVIATNPEIISNKLSLFKKCVTNREQRVWPRLFVQSITGSLD